MLKNNYRFGLSTGSMYVRTFFDEDAKRDSLVMIDNIKRVFRDKMIHSDWMSKAVKTKALEKLSGITDHIAYPNELLNDRALEDYYAEV